MYRLALVCRGCGFVMEAAAAALAGIMFAAALCLYSELEEEDRGSESLLPDAFLLIKGAKGLRRSENDPVGESGG